MFPTNSSSLLDSTNATSDGSGLTLHMPGSAWMAFFNLPRIPYEEAPAVMDSPDRLKAFDVFMLVAFWFASQLLEYAALWRATVQHGARVCTERKQVKGSWPAMAEASKGDPVDVLPPIRLTAEALSYEVEVKTGTPLTKSPCGGLKDRHVDKQGLLSPSRLRLLDHIDASFDSGEMTALMGESGAGKTTLLDVIAGYKTGGHITGDIRLNGEPITTSRWQLLAAYAEQSDIHEPYMSVSESLTFAAATRSPDQADASSQAERALELLELGEWRDMLCGSKVPRHVLKRLTVGVELLARPRVLFVDEPTTGLSDQAAAMVIRCIRKVTRSMEMATVITIHQPSSEVFEAFDKLLLLRRGGRVAYHGPVGVAACDILTYSQHHLGASPPPAGANPAEFAVDVFSTEAAVAVWAAQGAQELREQAEPSAELPAVAPPAHPLNRTFWRLTMRQMVALWRNDAQGVGIVAFYLGFGLLLAFTFFETDDSSTSAIIKVAACFWAGTLSSLPCFSSLVTLFEQRAVFYRETASGTYPRLIYTTAQQLAELPGKLLCTTVFWAILIPLTRLTTDPSAEYGWVGTYGNYWFLMFSFQLVLPSLAQLISFCSPNMDTASAVVAMLIGVLILTLGFMISYAAMPSYWQWFYWINPFHYFIQGMSSVALGGQHFLLSVGSDKLVAHVPALGNLPDGAAGVVQYAVGILPQADDPLTIAAAAKGVAQILALHPADSVFSELAELRADVSDAIEVAQAGLLGCLVRNNCTTSADAVVGCLKPAPGNLIPACLGAIIAPTPLAWALAEVVVTCMDKFATTADQAMCAVWALLPDAIRADLIALSELPKDLRTLVADVKDMVANRDNSSKLELFKCMSDNGCIDFKAAAATAIGGGDTGGGLDPAAAAACFVPTKQRPRGTPCLSDVGTAIGIAKSIETCIAGVTSNGTTLVREGLCAVAALLPGDVVADLAALLQIPAQLVKLRRDISDAMASAKDGLFGCIRRYQCLTFSSDGINADQLVSCFLPSPHRLVPPCASEVVQAGYWTQALSARVVSCMDGIPPANATNVKKAECVISALVPVDVISDILSLTRLAGLIFYSVGLILMPLLEQGLLWPGDGILYIFDWADWDGSTGTFDSRHVWWYCIFALVLTYFILEVLKALASRFICWVRR